MGTTPIPGHAWALDALALADRVLLDRLLQGDDPVALELELESLSCALDLATWSGLQATERVAVIARVRALCCGVVRFGR